MLYDANYDKDLIIERNKAKDLCHKYNQLLPSDEENQQAIMNFLYRTTIKRGAAETGQPHKETIK